MLEHIHMHARTHAHMHSYIGVPSPKIPKSSLFSRSAAGPPLFLRNTVKVTPVCVGRQSYPAQVQACEERPYPFTQFSRVQLSRDNKLDESPLL